MDVREKLVELFYDNNVRCDQKIEGLADDVMDIIVNVASVRHGRWVCVDTDTEQFFLCNMCNGKEYWETEFCPNCGCRMDGGDD